MRLLTPLVLPWGSVGRGRFWLILLLCGLLQAPTVLTRLRLGEEESPLPALDLEPTTMFVMSIAGLYLLAVAAVNRLHDRARTGFWLLPVLLPWLVRPAARLIEVTGTRFEDYVALPPAALLWANIAVYAIAALTGLWILIECGVLPRREDILERVATIGLR